MNPYLSVAYSEPSQTSSQKAYLKCLSGFWKHTFIIFRDKDNSGNDLTLNVPIPDKVKKLS